MIIPEVLIDTNILIAHVMGHERLIFEPKQIGISTITMFEMLSLAGLSQDEERKIRELLTLTGIFSVTPPIAEKASNLARTRKKKHVLDLLIAATALELGIPLMTKNIKDFKNLSDLQVVTRLP